MENPWEEWGLTYREDQGIPFLTGQQLVEFKIAFPDRFIRKDPNGPVTLRLDRDYVVSEPVGEMHANYLRPKSSNEQGE